MITRYRWALVPAIALLSTMAQAQDVPQTQEDDSIGIGDIVVTAQRRSENIQDVPIAISAIGSQFIESRGITSIDALSTVAPNVKIERAPSSKTISQIAIRGSVTINPAITWEPAVGLYMDGVYIAKAQGSIFDIADLERVEVLRGPQGTLYGRNALAGAVNLVTRAPTGEAGGSIDISYASFDQIRTRAVLDLPQMGIFSVKLSGQMVQRGGLVDMVPNPYPAAVLAGRPQVQRIDTVNSYSFMARVRAELSDSITADYTFDWNRQRQRPPLAQLLRVNRNGGPADIFDPASPSYIAAAPLNLYANPNRVGQATLDGPIYERSRAYGHALTLTADLGGATLKSITAYRDLNWADGLDLDGSPLDIAYTQRITDYHAFSEELQLTGQALDDRLDYVIGAFYFKEKAETLGPQRFFGLFGPFGSYFQSDYGSHTEAFALYSQLDYRLTDQLSLTLGGRYTHERKDVRRFFAAGSPLTTVINLPYGGVPDATYNNFSPAVTLAYAVNDDVNLYARFARGFKSGGFNGETNVFFDPGAPAGCPSGLTELCIPYDPEKVDSYELGIKTRLFDDRVTFNIAAFRDNHSDIQLSIFTATGAAASVVRNAASARIQGLEFETVIRATDGLTFNGSLAFLDASYRSYIDGGVDVSNNRAFPHTPKFSATLGMDWRVIEGDWGRFNVSGDVNHVSGYYTFPYALRSANPSDQVAGSTRSPGRTIVNLRAAFSNLRLGGSTLEVAGFVRNLTNENDPSNFIDFGPAFGGILLGYFPDPRSYGISLGIKF